MAIIDNTSSEIGDVLIIKAEVPLIGLLTLTSFIDSVVGVTGTRFFTKEFRYSLDGINFSLWTPLTVPNISAIAPISYIPFAVEYRYTRDGTDPSGLLEFDFVELQGTFEEITCGPAYNDSPFALFFTCIDLELFGWCLNVLEKIYELGIVPKYIERNQDENANFVDVDYLDFWRSITCFFSYLVNYARVYENFHTNQDLLFEYLTQRGMYICPDNPDQSEMQYLMEFIFDEVRKRGTVQIAEMFVSDGGVTIRGELLRLICFDACNEFIFRLSSQYELGWTVDNSSPLYQGYQGFRSLTQGYEFSAEVEDLTLYPQTNPGFVSVVNDPIPGFDVIQLAGTGSIGNSTDTTKRITVDPNQDYEISFFVRKDTLSPNMSFYCNGFDAAGNLIQLTNLVTALGNSAFYELENLNLTGLYYKVTGIIRKIGSVVGQVLDIGFGGDLVFTSNVCSIMPQITNVFGPGNIFLYDIKVRPLRSEHSVGFIHPSQVIMSWMKNNNGQYTDEQVEDRIRQYLIPLNTTVIYNWL